MLFSSAAFPLLVSAALFGPVVNTVLNYLLFGPLFKTKLNVKRELRAHAAGAGLAAAGGGYSSYVALSNTAIHRKVGGTTKLSTYVAAAICALFVVAHPLCAVVGYMPTLVVAAICVYIGADFLYDNLAEPFAARWARAAGRARPRAERRRRELGGPPPLREEGHAPRHGGGRAGLSGRRAAREINISRASCIRNVGATQPATQATVHGASDE